MNTINNILVLLLVLLFLQADLSAQNFIGFRNSISYSLNNENSFELDSDSVIESRSVKDIDIDLFLIKKLKKLNIKYQIGYRQFSSTRNLFQGTYDRSGTLFNQRTNIRYHASIGINNYIDLKPLKLFYGVELPFSYELKQKTVNLLVRMDENENTTNSFESIYDTPQQLHFGLNLDFKIYYFYKKIGIGVELINGFQIQKANGERTTENNIYDSNNILIESATFTESEDRMALIKRSYIAIGLMYQFNKKDK